MSSETFSFSARLGSREPADPTRLIARPFDSWPLDGDRRLVLCAGDTHPVTARAFVVQCLIQCDRLRTLDEHLQVIQDRMPQLRAHLPAVRQGLEQMRQGGVLVGEAAVFERLAADSGTDGRGRLDTLYIRTCGRPVALRRLLESLPAAGQPAAVRRVAVLDDSRTPDEQARTRRLVEEFAGRAGPELIYVGRAMRSTFASELAGAADCNPGHLDWCLNGDPHSGEASYGCGSNLALLLSAGGHFALIDDDARLEPWGLGEPDESLVLAPRQFRRARFFEPDADDFPGCQRLELDPLAGHASVLGRTLSRLIHDQAGHTKTLLAELDSASLHALRPGGRVKLSINGNVGDPGTRDMVWQFQRPPEELAPWLAGAEAYERLACGRNMARASSSRRAYIENNLMSTLLGVDNSELLLPVLPQGRNEDLFFGELVSYLYPGALFFEHPWMLPHRPESARRWRRDELAKPRRITVGSFLTAWVNICGQATISNSAGQRAGLLAAAFRALGDGSRQELEAAFAQELMIARSVLVEGVTRTRDELDPPEYLAADFDLLVETNAGPGPDDAGFIGEQAALAGRVAAGYGAAVESWIAAWNHCREQGEDRMLERIRATGEH